MLTYSSQRSPLESTPLIPESFAARYRDCGYWVEETIPDFLRSACLAHADRQVLVAPAHSLAGEDGKSRQVRWTYGELARYATAAARRLQAAGVGPGDRVLLQLPNTAEYLVYLLGIFWAGALPVFCLPQHRQRELAHFARRTDAAAHVFSSLAGGTDFTALYEAYAGELAGEGLLAPVAVDAAQTLEPEEQMVEAPIPVVRNGSSDRPSEQVAFLQLSGGTTGLSKLIPRTHAAYLYSVRESARICGLTAATRMLVVLPAAHNFTMSSPGILGAFHCGASLVFAADPSPQTAFNLIEAEQVTFAALVPPLAQAWIASAERRAPDLSSLETVQVGGAKLLPSVAARIRPVLGAKLQQVFGMAEGLVNYTREGDPEDTVLTTQGTPISPDDEIRVVDDQDRAVPAGESGHLLTRGPYTIRGYYREERANRDGFTEDGFYRTGDIVRVHPGGHIEVTGRAKDQINRNGEKIAVDEIEDLALTHPGVHDAVALGIPDETVGERVALVLVPTPGTSFAHARRELHDYFTAAGLAPYKIPERVEVYPQLPVTNIGKISRRELREQLLTHLANQP